MGLKTHIYYTAGILFAIFLAISSFIQAQRYNFVPYTVENGLSQSQHKLVFEDSRGFLWFGSYEGGLSKYDGYSFEIINSRKGLINDKVQAMTEDAEGRVWVGTYKGISIIDKHKISHFDHAILNDQSILQLEQHSNGSIWIATGNAGFFIYQQDSLYSLNDILAKPLGTAYHFAFTKDKAYLAADGKLYYISLNKEGLPKKEINELTFDYDGIIFTLATKGEQLWIGSDKGLYTLQSAEEQIKPLIEAIDVRHIYLESTVHWIATYGDGIFRINADGSVMQFTTQNGLINNRVQHMIKDRSGSLWLATFAGVNQLASFDFFHYRQEHGLADDFVWGIKELPNGEVWIAHNEGLDLLVNGEFIHLGPQQGFHAQKAWGLALDKEGQLWIGAEDGLYLRKNKDDLQHIKHHFEGENDYIFTLWPDQSGKIWTAGNRQINWIYPNNPEKSKVFPRQKDLPAAAINTIFQDSKGHFWIGLEAGGLFFYDEQKDLLIQIKELSDTGTDIINEVVEDSEGNLWVASSLNGLYMIPSFFKAETPTRIVNYGQDIGLFSENIYALQVDKAGNLWIGTERGIQQLKIKDGLIKDIINYDRKNGFTGIEVNHKAVSLAQKDALWWGTINGLTKHQNLEQNNLLTLPPLYIERIDLDFQALHELKEVEPDQYWQYIPEDLKLMHHENNLSFHFKAVSSTHSDQIRYRYKLIGLQEDWSPLSTARVAVISNIPSGDYTFIVRAYINGQNEFVQKEYSFTIQKPFWLQWWFILISLIFLGLLISLFFRYRVRQLRLQRILLTKKVKERTRQIEKQKEEIEEQKHEIESQRDQLADKSDVLEQMVNEMNQKNLQITDSINYAKRIQSAIFPSHFSLHNYFREALVFYQPKDIVSGDFYWFTERDGLAYIAVADCTGHGVPGAFMSIIGNSLLNQGIIENKLEDPSEILRFMHNGVRNILKQHEETQFLEDGMDIGLLVIDAEKKIIRFAGAKRPLYMVDEDGLTEIYGDKNSIGGHQKEYSRQFVTKPIPWKASATYYLLTDGYADQFGGPKDKKFMIKKLKKLLSEWNKHSASEIHEQLKYTMSRWMANTNQTDDMLVLGLRLPIQKK